MKHLPKILAFALISLGTGVLAAHAQNYAPLAPLPGTFTETAGVKTTNISMYLSGAIKLLIALGVGLAVLFAIIGGTQYVAASINPSAKKDALERIQKALIGLTIILTSYLLLNSINPKLVDVKFSLDAVTPSVSPTVAVTPVGVCPSPNDASSACCPSQLTCRACTNCSVLPASIPNKGCGAGKTCFLSTAILSKIQSISGINGWRITESWPPTVDHLSQCHQDGTCADLNNSGGQTDPTTIKAYYDAFRAAGLTVIYENSNCAPYTAIGVSCGSYETQTNGSSFHVR